MIIALLTRRIMKTRRSSSDAKDFILDIAEEALIEVGVKGLKISHLAKLGDMRHSNIIYHFGSIEGVRTALMNRLIGRHVSEIMNIVKEVNHTKPEPASAITTLIISRIFKMYSEPYMPALIGWKLSNSSGEPIHEVEIMIEGFIQVTSSKLMELGQIAQSKRENVLTIVTMVLSVCIGNMFINSLWSKNLTSPEINKSLEEWVTKTVIKMSTGENNELNKGL